MQPQSCNKGAGQMSQRRQTLACSGTRRSAAFPLVTSGCMHAFHSGCCGGVLLAPRRASAPACPAQPVQHRNHTPPQALAAQLLPVINAHARPLAFAPAHLRLRRSPHSTVVHARAGPDGGGGGGGDGDTRITDDGASRLQPPARSADPLPVVVPVVLDEHDVAPTQRPSAGAATGRSVRPAAGSGASAPALGPDVEPAEAAPAGPYPAPPLAAARWPALVLVPAVLWGITCTLAPGVDAAAAAAPAAAAVAAVDWVDVALRTTAGLTAADGGVGRSQVLAALEEAGAGRAAGWAVMAVLPGLCTLARGCRAATAAVLTALPWLQPLSQLAAAAAGLGVLLLLAMPLRPYLAPLLPLLPRGRPSPATLAALRAGGAVCMVVVLTALQAQELTAPPLVPSVRGAAAAAALSSPLLLQTQALIYGAAAVAADAVLPACTAVVAAGTIRQLLRQRHARKEGVLRSTAAANGTADMDSAGASARSTGPDGAAGLPAAAATTGRGSAVFGAVKALAAGRLLLDLMLLLAVAAGALPGKISAVRLLGMLWLLQTAAQL
ncbi:hypothetical protein PLESTF_000268600 [Pleodorina starrii]|nr:hypothetical protein PLESTF_000268600 [Pleodorina starrii]